MSGHIRCAVYTRKSSEEGLEQSFNSLHAQREACDAYIRSQRHEGWRAIPTSYDDGGFSGGSMARPALKRLLCDIAGARIDTVVVYKVDRLTRSLADFAKLIEQFDAKNVSFVSVTQPFNTTSSMGRLTLNVLLSFAQFEREVTGERIRDKIAASKAKGMWMGGRLPLGYDLHDRALQINPKEADSVREIFNQYLRLRSISALKAYLDQSPIRSKARIERGEKVGDGKFSYGALHRILRNHIFVGEVVHKKTAYVGEHHAIIGRGQWDQVQKVLDDNRQGRIVRRTSSPASVLKGLIFDAAGNRFTPTHAKKAGRRYRYYTSRAVIRKAAFDQPMGRIPAVDLEDAILKEVFRFLRSPEEIVKVMRFRRGAAARFEGLLRLSIQQTKKWTESPSSEQWSVLKSILKRVVILETAVEIHLNYSAVLQALLEEKFPYSADELRSENPIILRCALGRIYRGKATCLLIGENQNASNRSIAAIIKAIARSRQWYDEIVAGKARSTKGLAKSHGLAPCYVNKILPCALLGPEVIESILNAQTGPGLTLDRLLANLPMSWDQQVECIQ